VLDSCAGPSPGCDAPNPALGAPTAIRYPVWRRQSRSGLLNPPKSTLRGGQSCPPRMKPPKRGGQERRHRRALTERCFHHINRAARHREVDRAALRAGMVRYRYRTLGTGFLSLFQARPGIFSALVSLRPSRRRSACVSSRSPTDRDVMAGTISFEPSLIASSLEAMRAARSTPAHGLQGGTRSTRPCDRRRPGRFGHRRCVAGC
jgi:hypothetical protein